MVLKYNSTSVYTSSYIKHCTVQCDSIFRASTQTQSPSFLVRTQPGTNPAVVST